MKQIAIVIIALFVFVGGTSVLTSCANTFDGELTDFNQLERPVVIESCGSPVGYTTETLILRDGNGNLHIYDASIRSVKSILRGYKVGDTLYPINHSQGKVGFMIDSMIAEDALFDKMVKDILKEEKDTVKNFLEINIGTR